MHEGWLDSLILYKYTISFYYSQVDMECMNIAIAYM